MNEFAMKIIPVISFFFLGIFFRHLKLFKEQDGHLLLRLVFYLFLPALSFLSVIETNISKELLVIPMIPLIPILVNFLIASIFLKFFPQKKSTAGIVYCGSMIMNTGFTLPFFGAAFGMEGFSKAILFDLGNLFFIFTFIYFVAVKHGDNKVVSKKLIIKKFLYMPPLWAFLIGIIFVLFNTPVHQTVISFLSYASDSTIPMIMLSLGLLFNPKLKNLPKALTVVFIRMVCGFYIGFLIANIFPFDHMTKKIIVASCSAPVGYNTLIFAALENLDEAFGATVVSASILIGIIYIPFIFLIMR